jgi:hypothetical protein
MQYETRISVISSRKDFDECYSSLFYAGYSLFYFKNTEKAYTSDSFFLSDITILDGIDSPEELGSLLETIHTTNPEARVILVWDREHLTSSDILPRVYYVISKPVCREKLSDVIARAAASAFPFESRCEQRIPVEYTVDFYFHARVWETRTVNMSTGGLQAVWPEQTCLMDIERYMYRDASPFTTCRLFKNGDSPISIPVSLKYMTPANPDEQFVLLGFQFDDLDSALKKQLAELVTS